MVLGMIVYETVDIAYNVLKIGYNGIVGTYNWWYSVEPTEVVVAREETKAIHELEDRIHNLERLLEENVERKKEEESDDNK